MVVDDEPGLRRLLDLVLSDAGYRVLEADCAESALQEARKARPDLVIMDVMMPGGLDGLDATRQLKGDPATDCCPVLAVSALPPAFFAERARACGAVDIIAKPFDPRVLVARVNTLLADRSAA